MTDDKVYRFHPLPSGPTDTEVDEALARLAPGVHEWSHEERERMRAVLAAPSDDAALMAWSRTAADGPLRNVHVAALRAVREAHAWGRQIGGRP